MGAWWCVSIEGGGGGGGDLLLEDKEVAIPRSDLDRDRRRRPSLSPPIPPTPPLSPLPLSPLPLSTQYSPSIIESDCIVVCGWPVVSDRDKARALVLKCR